MNTLRKALAITICVALGAGYAVSQLAYFGGWAPVYRDRADTPLIKGICLLVLVVLVGSCFLRLEEQAKQ